MDVRTVAFKLLQKTFKEDGFSNHLYEAAVNKNPEWSEADRRFLKAIYFGVLRKLLLLDHVLAGLYKGDYAKVPENIKIILRIGLYQIISMEKVPHYAVINEAVNFSKKVGHKGTTGLVNALLRKASKIRDDLMEVELNLLKIKDIRGLSVSTSHPEWLVNKYVLEHGLDKTLRILNANNSIPNQNFRVRDFGELEKASNGTGLKIERNLFNKVGASVQDAPPELIEKLKYDKTISPQDQSSLIAVSLTDGAGGRILELCCSRGNKTDAMLKYVDNKAIIINADRMIRKLIESKSVVQKSSVRCHPVCCDILQPLPFIEKYQLIFLDSPCSGLGVVRRHPEIRYRQSPSKIVEMAEIQLRALTNASVSLQLGGTLIYCVCSFEMEETFGVIDKFLGVNPQFTKVDIGLQRPDLTSAGLVTDGCLRILPGEHGMDGFFAAMLKYGENEQKMTKN